MKLQKSNFGLVALFLLLTIACLGACNRFELVGDKYIVTNKRGNDTIFIQEGMQPDTFYALGYKTFDMKSVAIYKGEKLLTRVTQTAGVYSKDLGEAEFEKDGNIRKLVIYTCYDKINSNKAFIYASPLAPILPQWAQAGNIFLCGTSENYLKRGDAQQGRKA